MKALFWLALGAVMLWLGVEVHDDGATNPALPCVTCDGMSSLTTATLLWEAHRWDDATKRGEREAVS